MVAISLYKGNLHRTPDTPRQWLMPARKISLKEFKVLLERRSRALARLQSNHATTSNPNPNSDHSNIEKPQSNGFLKVLVDDSTAYKVDGVDELVNSDEDDDGKKGSTGDDDDSVVIPSGELVAQEVAAAKAAVQENGSNGAVDCLRQGDILQATAGDQLESPKDDNDTLSDREKRKKEIEEKLQILNERKHKLVQVLKQILHAEEELWRRNNVQVVTGRPVISLQVDVTNDSGSMSRHVTPRPGSEGADGELADTDDVSNQNTHPRNMTRMSSMSPSSDSLHRRTPFSMSTTLPMQIPEMAKWTRQIYWITVPTELRSMGRKPVTRGSCQQSIIAVCSNPYWQWSSSKHFCICNRLFSFTRRIWRHLSLQRCYQAPKSLELNHLIIDLLFFLLSFSGGGGWS